jgi:hypothetical protein
MTFGLSSHYPDTPSLMFYASRQGQDCHLFRVVCILWFRLHCLPGVYPASFTSRVNRNSQEVGCYDISLEPRILRHLHKTMAHPVHRDIRPAGNPKASSLCQSLAMGATQTMLAACITFGLIICVGGGEAPSMTPLIVSGQFRPLYSPAQWIRRLPQSLIFIRPLSQLTAWLVEKAVELGSPLYHIFTGDIPVGPQQANTEVGTQTVG